MGRLDGRIAVVSGGASGIGRAAAIRLASEGAIVEIIDKDDARTACQAIVADGGKAASAICDVTQEEQVNSVARTVEDRHGRIDIIVNSAGILTRREPWYLRSRADLERFIDVNYLGAYGLMKALHSLLKKSSHGRIIMIGSRTVFTANADMAGYVESKAAVTALTRNPRTRSRTIRHHRKCSRSRHDCHTRYARPLGGGDVRQRNGGAGHQAPA